MIDKYVCCECGQNFDDPSLYKEDYGMGGGFYETGIMCPLCGSFEVAIACSCEKCGAAYPEEQSKFHLCVECEDDALVRFRALFEEFLDTISGEFDENERAAINYRWDGEPVC